ncbi:MAG: FkbM family methyltransferase [Salinivirgaceae bacterium]|nr:FkbM family methyltransferase [Salinivirgaceae bacterium]
MKIISTIKKKLIEYLNNKNGRLLLSIIFSLISSLKKMKCYTISYDKETRLWLHKKGGETLVVEDLPDFAISKKRMTAVTLRTFFKYYTPQAKDTLVDIGAGVENDVYVINSHFEGSPAIYAIEAHPNTFRKLSYMVKKNNYSNVHCHNIAIVEEKKELYISDADNHSANRISENEGGCKVEGLTMDEFVKKNNISKIDFLKMNIEGAEREALIGMKETLQKVSNIMVACHDKLSQYYDNDPYFITRDFVVKTLEENNFKILEEDETPYHINIFAQKRINS